MIIALVGYAGFRKFRSGAEVTRYVLAAVERGTLVVSITGSGQVAVSNQVDLKSKVAGTIISVDVANGQEVKAGKLVAQLDAREALQAVRDAEVNLESAELALQKLKQPTDALTLLQAQNALSQAKVSREQAANDLAKSYEDGYTAVTNALLALPPVVTGIKEMLFSSTIERTQWNIDWYANQVYGWDGRVKVYRDDLYNLYQNLQKETDALLSRYQITARTADTAALEQLILDSYSNAKSTGDLVKSADRFLDFIKDLMTQHEVRQPAILATHQASLDTYTASANTHIASLLAITRTISNTKDQLAGSERTIAEKTEQLAKLNAGVDALDLRTQELAVKQKLNARRDAREKLADYTVRAPFDGLIARVDAKRGDQASAATTLATLITRQKLAEISFNEVDVAKIKIGQAATLTFDAVPGLALTGKVAEIDAVGTVSQGVVTYTVKVAFDTLDERVKPGMTVSAAVIIDSKAGVLLAPVSAIKSDNEENYVEVVTDRAAGNPGGSGGVELASLPERVRITTGLANDEFSEITGGLAEGTLVVARTIAPLPAANQTSQRSLFSVPGGGRGGITGGGGGLRSGAR